MIKYIRLTIIAILGGISIGYTSFSAPNVFTLTPDRPGCDTPIHWDLKDFDDRFPGSEKDFLFTVFEAEKIWEDTIGKNLFNYDGYALFKVRTEFDERQEQVYDSQYLEEQINKYNIEKESLQKKYSSLKKQYEDNLKSFNSDLVDYNNNLSDYNSEVKKWNKSGGAPQDIFEKLEKELKKLNKKREELEKQEKDLFSLLIRTNDLASKLNIQADNINKEIETFNEKYGAPTPFIQGLYTPILDNITVFQYEAQDDLRLVLVHELGHALGIEGHVENPSSIMHFMMGEQDINNPKLSEEDIAAYNAACPPRTFSKSEQLKRYLIFTNWKDIKIMDFVEIFTS